MRPILFARYLLLPGLAFHAVIYCTLPVYTFSATMVVLYLAYFDPDDVHGFIDRLQGRSSASDKAGTVRSRPRHQPRCRRNPGTMRQTTSAM